MKNLAIVFCMGLVFSISTSMAFGYVQFYAAFKKTYVKENSPEEFKTLVTKTKCAICHDSTKKTQTGKTDKKFRNPYGTALDALLGKEDKQDKEKIYDSLEIISNQRASDSNPYTYGDRIQSHKLPYPVTETIKYGSTYGSSYEYIK